MGVSVEIVDQQACAGGDVRSCMIIGDYVYVAGEYIERFPLDRVNHTLGNGEVLGGGLYREALNMYYDGEYVSIKGYVYTSIVRFRPSVYDDYTEHDSVYSSLEGIVQSSDGDYHLFGYGEGWKIYRFQSGNFDFIQDGAVENVHNMQVVGNLILVAGINYPENHKFYGYTWNGSTLVKVYEYDLDSDSSHYRPSAISVFGNTILVAQDGYSRVCVFKADWSTNTITYIKEISLGHAFAFYGTSFNGLYYCGMTGSHFKVYSFYDDELTLVNSISMSGMDSSNCQCQTHIDDKHMVCVDGNNVYLGKQILKAQAEFPNGTSGEAPFHLTARAI